MALDEKLNRIISRYTELNKQLLDPNSLSSEELQKIAKESSDLKDVVELAEQYNKLILSQQEIEALLDDRQIDTELKEIAEQEKYDNKHKLKNLQDELQVMLLPKDEADEKSAILEIRAGAGGAEAALFAAALFGMYQRYAEKNGWKFEIMNLSETGLDGYKEATASINGKNVFAYLKFESGVHRVQRVPETESSGRIHTSTATVAVLPQAEDVDIEIEDKDLKIDVFRASGAGGQHVNTTDSAVRITHLPTGVVVTQQDEKSQHKNRAKALKILRSRIYEMERNKKAAELSAMRKGQVGSGDRSERIRTYNYPQSRITDHRIHLTIHNLDEVLGEGKLDELINALQTEERANKLAQ